jgi:hypothetical protein
MTYRVSSIPSYNQPIEKSTPWVVDSRGSQEELASSQQSNSSEDLPSTPPYEMKPDFASSALLDQDEEGEGYLFPEIRFPPVNPCHDTAYFNEDLTPRSVHGSNELFSEEAFILKKHVMKYLDCNPYPATRKVVAITREGKYIVWQQAIRSCVPAAISMIALDRKRRFLGEEITYAVTTGERMLRYIQKAGFEPIKHSLQGNSFDKVKTLEQLIAKLGPGLLHLDHPELKSHLVVLDEISLERWCATLREPYHGYMVTVKLFPFMEWIGEEFIECSDQKSSL